MDVGIEGYVGDEAALFAEGESDISFGIIESLVAGRQHQDAVYRRPFHFVKNRHPGRSTAWTGPTGGFAVYILFHCFRIRWIVNCLWLFFPGAGENYADGDANGEEHQRPNEYGSNWQTSLILDIIGFISRVAESDF